MYDYIRMHICVFIYVYIYISVYFYFLLSFIYLPPLPILFCMFEWRVSGVPDTDIILVFRKEFGNFDTLMALDWQSILYGLNFISILFPFFHFASDRRRTRPHEFEMETLTSRCTTNTYQEQESLAREVVVKQACNGVNDDKDLNTTPLPFSGLGEQEEIQTHARAMEITIWSKEHGKYTLWLSSCCLSLEIENEYIQLAYFGGYSAPKTNVAYGMHLKYIRTGTF